MAPPKKTNVADPIEPPPANGKGEPPARILIPLTMDGSVDWNRIRTPNRQAKVRRILKELKTKLPPPPGAAADGAPASASAAPLDLFNAQWTDLAIDSVGRLEFAAAVRAGCTRDEARLFLYSPDEKKLLADPLARVLNKYGNQWLARYQDECALAALLISIHATKVTAVQAMRQARAKGAAPADRVVHLADRQAPPASSSSTSSSSSSPETRS